MGSLDQVMENASAALVRMDYLACESLCLQALAQARAGGDWDYYARVLLPLQESRRQRRMIAADGLLRLGTREMTGDDQTRLAILPAGCVVLTRPATPAAARGFAQQAQSDRRFVEVLFADNESTDPRWTIRSFAGPDVSCVVDAPPREWVDRWLKANDAANSSRGKTPSDWFIDATEALGDAALAQAASEGESIMRIEACLQVVTDHEIIHQRLATAARAMVFADKAVP